MRLWIVCSAEGEMHAGAMNSEEYREARRAALSAAAAEADAKPLRREGRVVYISRMPSARLSAETLCPGGGYIEHPALDEAEPSPGLFSHTALPLALRARLDAPGGDRLRKARAEAETLAEELERAGQDCILFSHPGRILQLMDAFRRRGYCFARSEIGKIRPGERILGTSRTAHCGVCGHYCMLSSPGCGIGRDKARRAGIPYTMKLGEGDGTDKK